MKSLYGCDLNLELFQKVFLKFNNFSSPGTNHVVMVLAQMTVFISNGAIVKAALMGKTKAAHELHGFTNEFRFELPAVLVKKCYQFIDRNMLFCL